MLNFFSTKNFRKILVIIIIPLIVFFGLRIYFRYVQLTHCNRSASEIGNLNYGYHKEWGHVYKYYNHGSDGCDLSKIEIRNIDTDGLMGLSRDYFKNKNNVYFLPHPYFINFDYLDATGLIIKNADPQTFESLGNDYTKDKNHVYRNGEIVEEADPENFEF